MASARAESRAFSCMVDSTDAREEAYFEELTLLAQKKGLRYGDLIYANNEEDERNAGLCIYDGKRVVDLEDSPDDYGTLPPQFRVLEPHPETKEIIPVCYWHNSFGKAKDGRYICHNNYVWFDITPYLRELRKNVNYSELWGRPRVWTCCKSKYDGSTIYIVVKTEDDEYSSNKMKKEFKKKISSVQPRKSYLFECLDDDYVGDHPNQHPQDQNILFLDARFVYDYVEERYRATCKHKTVHIGDFTETTWW